MAQNTTAIEYQSDLNQVSQGVEQLVNETQATLEGFKKEQSLIKTQLQLILDENRTYSNNFKIQQCTTSVGSDDVDNMRVELTNEAINNSRNQIKLLLQERKELTEINEIAQRTIKNLELEVDNYRKQLFRTDQGKELKRKYENAVQILELQISQQNMKIEEQANIIKTLHRDKLKSFETIGELEAKLYATTKEPTEKHRANLAKYEQQLQTIMLEKREFEKSLQFTKSLLEETTKREAIAMNKVQESLVVAETAMREKREAECRADTFKEECTQLATNIGLIMDQAAQQVDDEVGHLKTKLADKDKCLNELRQKLEKEQEAFKNKSQYLEARYNRLEQKFKEQLKENQKLSEEIKVTNERMEKLERKMGENERERLHQHHQQYVNEIKKQYENQITDYMIINKKLKHNYKAAILDLTGKFEKEIYNMKKENSDLKAHLELIKSSELAQVVNEIAKSDETKEANYMF